MSKLAWAAGIFLGLAGLGAIMPKPPPAQQQSTPQTNRVDPAANYARSIQAELLEQLSIDKAEWRKVGGGAIAEARFSIKNKGNIALKDPRLECSFLGSSGTILTRRSITISQYIDQQFTLRTAWLNLSFIDQQSTSMRCEIVAVSRI
jgi:hypothetical protein